MWHYSPHPSIWLLTSSHYTTGEKKGYWASEHTLGSPHYLPIPVFHHLVVIDSQGGLQDTKSVFFTVTSSSRRAYWSYRGTFFSLIIFQYWTKNVKIVQLMICVIAGLPQRLKSNYLKKFSHFTGACPAWKKFQKTLILAFEANTVHFPAKMDFFFPRFSSLWQRAQWDITGWCYVSVCCFSPSLA